MIDELIIYLQQNNITVFMLSTGIHPSNINSSKRRKYLLLCNQQRVLEIFNIIVHY